MDGDTVEKYLNRQTLIAGDVNSGKTTRTMAIIQLFLDNGYGPEMAILDLAPDPVRGIGGKLSSPVNPDILYLTDLIIPPRLTGRDDAHILELAKENARRIESLFAVLQQKKRNILVVNDASLYLQGGNFEVFQKVLETSPTKIINAYYGVALGNSFLSRRERQLTEILIERSDEVILL